LQQSSKPEEVESNHSISEEKVAKCSDDVKLHKRRYSNFENDDEKIKSSKKRQLSKADSLNDEEF